MFPKIDFRLDRLMAAGQQHLLRHGRKGLEKESLRLSAEGLIATTPHPVALGSALTHPYITTDYSEALPELITPPFADPAETLAFLDDLHRFVYARLPDDECLLATSMPVGIEGDETIPIARYGTSNIGRMKHVYRKGLAYRYGRTMQAIAGVHFNYSVNEALWPVLAEILGHREPQQAFIASAYFDMIRNVHRHGWLVIYLFGMSPAVDRRFFTGRENLTTRFQAFDQETLYRPCATSLRMSDIGYRIDSQPTLDISFDSLDEYVAGLTRAISIPHPAYQRAADHQADDYRQLNANLLQIENEYYSGIRPKQVVKSGEKPTLALKKRGVQYVELRSLDLCCTSPGAVKLEQLYFLEVFLLFCLLAESPAMSRDERAETDANTLQTACCGREPLARLKRQGQSVLLREWGENILEQMQAVADVLDADNPARPYRLSVDSQRPLLTHPELTPSSLMLAEMRRNGESFRDYALRVSRQHAAHFRSHELDAGRFDLFRQEVDTSLREQQAIEVSDTLSFAAFLEAYFAQT